MEELKALLLKAKDLSATLSNRSKSSLIAMKLDAIIGLIGPETTISATTEPKADAEVKSSTGCAKCGPRPKLLGI